MNFQSLLNELLSSEKFKEFKKKNPKVYLCSGFFIINEAKELEKKHLDYYAPDSKEAFGFKLESFLEIEKLQKFEKVPEEIPRTSDFDFGKIRELIDKKLNEEKIKNKITKIIFSLQRLNSKNFLIVNVFLSGLILVNMKISLDNKKIIDFEKKSIFSFIRNKKS